MCLKRNAYEPELRNVFSPKREPLASRSYLVLYISFFACRKSPLLPRDTIPGARALVPACWKSPPLPRDATPGARMFGVYAGIMCNPS